MESQERTEGKGQGHTKRRQAALALVLALLAMVTIAATAHAYVARRTETTLVDFDSGIFSYTGLLDLPDEHIDSVQLMPVGLGGDWHTSVMTLPLRLANLATVVSGNRIYVVGGTDRKLNFRPEVYSYDVGLDGALSMPQTRSELPEARAAAGVTVYDGPTPVIYVVGGFGPGWAAKDTVFRAPINPSSGDVGPWVEDDRPVPTRLQSAPAVVHDGSLYVIGGWGWDGDSYNELDTVYRAPIGTSGALGDFVETSPLPEPLYDGVAIVYEGGITDTLYLIGGRNDITSTSKVFFADFKSSGELTHWTLSEGTLPVHLYGHDGVYLRGQIILTGGVVNSMSLSDGISSTVKAALVDPDNVTFRLYDWCEDAPPDCTIGAWQTGALLPEVRALHGAVAVDDYVYVLGGQDGDAKVRDTIFYGSVEGAGAVYAPEGTYLSDEIDLGQQAKLLQLEWDTTITRPDEMGLTMQYRYSLNGFDWVDGPEPVQSVDGDENYIDIIGQPEDVVYFQYQAYLSTTVPTASPRLNSVQLYYQVPDPDLAVIKDTGDVISAELGTELAYTIRYTNTGGWTAEDAMLTEVLPDNTTFEGPAEWQQDGMSNQYTYQLGDVPRDGQGTASFRVRVNDEVPPDTYYITNTVQIDFPPMLDARDNTIEDPFTDDNEYLFSNPLSIERAVDLVITDLVWEPTTTITGMWPQFFVTVTNIGTADAHPLAADGLGFWVELYIKPSPSEPPQAPWDHDRGFALDEDGTIVWRQEYVDEVNQLPAGTPIQVSFPALDQEPSPDFPAAGTYDIYAQVDVAIGASDPYWGRYAEGNEENNVAQATMVVVDFDPKYYLYLPVILRSAP